MKATSPLFARIQRDVFAIVASIPKGALVSFRAIGVHLDLVPRHIAYILAMPDQTLRDEIPWHRVVPHDGVLRTAKAQRLATQRSLLRR
jgi:methylated-DNA-protein-cysteine methyltransferase related protein